MSGVVECVILVGVPASGKTSFYREYFAGTHDHVSKDLMRNNRRPQRRQEQLIGEALGEGRSVVVDNTNPSVETRAPLIALARANRARVIGYFFPTDAATALRRNRGREGEARVPDVAIFTSRKKLQPPSYDEGFDSLFEVMLDEQARRFDIRALPRESIPPS
jgi:predicted kinase